MPSHTSVDVEVNYGWALVKNSNFKQLIGKLMGEQMFSTRLNYRSHDK